MAAPKTFASPFTEQTRLARGIPMLRPTSGLYERVVARLLEVPIFFTKPFVLGFVRPKHLQTTGVR